MNVDFYSGILPMTRVLLDACVIPLLNPALFGGDPCRASGRSDLGSGKAGNSHEIFNR